MSMSHRRTFVHAALAGLTLLAASPVLAGTGEASALEREFSVGNWSGVAHVDARTGAFTRCVASAAYGDGTSLYFAISGAGTWSLGLANADWSLPAGGRLPVRYRVDTGTARVGTARFVSPTLADVALPDSKRLFDRMRRGRVLHVEAGGRAMSFALTASNRMLQRLIRCAAGHRRLIEARSEAAAPVAAVRSMARPVHAAPAERAARRAEALALSRQLTANAFRGVRHVPPAEAPGLYEIHDSVWSLDRVVGSVRIVPDAAPDAVDRGLGHTLEASCRGTLSTRARRADSAVVPAVLRAASCVGPDGRGWNTVLGTFARPAGGAYVVQIFTTAESLATTLGLGRTLLGAAPQG